MQPGLGRPVLLDFSQLLWTDASFKELCGFYPQLYAEQNLQKKIYRAKDWNNDKETMMLPSLYRSSKAERDRALFVTSHCWDGLLILCRRP